MREKIIIGLTAVGILLLASFFRLYGFNWDQNQHLHPDERFLTMVTNAISWPDNLYDYLDTETSPLNPHNQGFGFFVYGTSPIFFTKWIAEIFKKGDYINLTLVGRQLSALFDVGTVVLVFLTARNIIAESGKRKAEKKEFLLHASRFTLNVFPLLSMFFYAASVLPIQLSHFFAVDTYLTFFITLSFYLLISLMRLDFALQGPTSARILLLNSLLGISFGLALAAKISAILFLPIILIGLTVYRIRYSMLTRQLILVLIFIISGYFTFRLAQPNLFANPDIFDFTPNEKVLDNWKQLKSFDDPSGGFPPAVQWIKTKPYLFPLKNMILWGLGLPLGIISILGIGYSIVTFRKKQLTILLSTFWILLLFFYQGFQFVKALRYFYPIYPFLAIISGYFVCKIGYCLPRRRWRAFYWGVIGLLVLIYPLSFVSIYSRPHSRVAASEWIYNNIPPGSYLSGEHWDDFLPLSLPKPGMIHEKYKSVEFPLYNPDKSEKWKIMEEKLKQTDYIILTSNRLYGSLTTVPEKYPETYKYYEKLFDGSLGFKKVAEFTSRPNLPIPLVKLCFTPPFARYGIISQPTQDCPLNGISLVDDYSDETFTVYDHPKVLIFKKVRPVDYFSVLFEIKSSQ